MKKNRIIPTSDSKTSMFPGDRNSFGLLPGPVSCGGTCVCATEGAGGCLDISDGRKTPECYVFRTISFRPAVYGVLRHNTELLVSSSPSEQEELISVEFERYYKSWERYTAYTKIQTPCRYRIHWAGDCFNVLYAYAMRAAMDRFTGRVAFWGYSRALFTVPAMSGSENCRWLLSLDDVNKASSMNYLRTFHPEILERKSNISYSYMSDRMPDDVPGLTPCPTDLKQVSHEQACMKCGKCPAGSPVWFKLK